jgi:hypothetical protein
MYGPPPDCKRFEVGEGTVCVNVSGLSPETPIQRDGCLGCSFNNPKSQLGGVPFELSDLSLAVLGLVDFGSLVHIFHPVAEHAVDQSRQLSGHGFDCNGGAELGSESAKLRSSSRAGLSLPLWINTFSRRTEKSPITLINQWSVKIQSSTAEWERGFPY